MILRFYFLFGMFDGKINFYLCVFKKAVCSTDLSLVCLEKMQNGKMDSNNFLWFKKVPEKHKKHFTKKEVYCIIAV